MVLSQKSKLNIFNVLIFLSLITFLFLKLSYSSYIDINTNTTTSQPLTVGDVSSLERFVHYSVNVSDEGYCICGYIEKLIGNIGVIYRCTYNILIPSVILKNTINIHFEYPYEDSSGNFYLYNSNCTYDDDKDTYICQNSSTDAGCWYDNDRELFFCKGISNTWDNSYYSFLNISFTPSLIPYFPFDELIDWKAIIRGGYYCNSDFDYEPLQIENSSNVLSPNLTLLGKDNESKALNWSNFYTYDTKTRNYPYVYVGDVLGLYRWIKNIRDDNHHGDAFGVWANITILNESVLSKVRGAGNYSINHFNSGMVVPNSSSSFNDNVFYYVKASGRGKTQVYYNVSDYSGKYGDNVSFTVYVLDPHVDVVLFPNKNVYGYGEKHNLSILVWDNASDVENITLNITREKVVNGNLINETLIYGLNDFKSHIIKDDKDMIYLVNYTKEAFFNSSGVYYLDAEVHLKNYTKILTSKKKIYVKEGALNLLSTSPQYRILTNQTGYFNLTFKVVRGDLHDVNLHIKFSNANLMRNISAMDFNLGNLTNGTIKNIKVKVHTNNTGLLSLIWYYNYTFNNTLLSSNYNLRPLEIVKPKIVFDKNTQRINESNNLKVMIVGNLTHIDLVKATINKTLFDYINTYSLSSPDVYGEGICYLKESQQSNTVFPSQIVNITNVDYANNSIDGDNSTYATFTTFNSVANLTYIFDKEYVFTGFNIYGRTPFDTSEVVKIYYYSDGIYHEIEETKDNTTTIKYSPYPQYTNITLLTPIRTSKILIAIKGSSVDYIHEITFKVAQINSTYPCYIYTKDLIDAPTAQINISGIYNVSIDVFQQGIATTSNYNSFFVKFGKPKIILSPKDSVGNIFSSNEQKPLEYIYIFPEGGDLYNISVHLNITNTTYINFSSGETPYKNITYLSYYNYSYDSFLEDENKMSGFLVKYNLSSGSITHDSLVPINVSVIHYQESQFVYNDSGFIKLIPSDSQPPNLTWWDFGYSNGEGGYILYNASNLYLPLYVIINASDDVAITKVIAELKTPQGYIINQTFFSSNISVLYGDFVNGTFIITYPSKYFNVTGNYSVRVYVQDYGGNVTTTNYTLNISIYDTFNVVIDNFASIYNRDQSFHIYALMRNMQKSKDINATFILTSSNHTTYISCIDTSCNTSLSSFDIFPKWIWHIKQNATPNIYTLRINLSYLKNKASEVFDFSTSDILDVETKNIWYNGKGDIAHIDVCVLYQNKYDNITSLDVGTLKCTSTGLLYSLSYSSSSGCFEPEGEFTCSVPTQLIINTSYHNNTGYLVKDVTPSSSNSPPLPSGGGGGGSSGKGNGGEFYGPSFDYNFTPPKVEKIPRLSIIPDTDSLYISWEEYINKIGVTFSNEGDLPLSLDINSSLSCLGCNSSMNVTHFNLDVGENRKLIVDLFIPLLTKDNTYYLKIYARDKSLNYTVTKIIPIVYEKKAKYRIYLKLVQSLLSINNKLREYGFMEKIPFFKIDKYWKKYYSLMDEAKRINESLRNNSLSSFFSLYSVFSDEVPELDAEVSKLNIYYSLYEERYRILVGAIIGAILGFLIYFYAGPLIYDSLKMKYINRQIKMTIKQRVEVEKQYFQRKIDEITFRHIMEKLQSKLIRLRKELDDVEYKYNLLRNFNILQYMKVHLFEKKSKRNLIDKKLTSYYERRSVWEKIIGLFKSKGMRLKEIEKDLIRLLVIEPKSHLMVKKKKEFDKKKYPMEDEKILRNMFKENEVDST